MINIYQELYIYIDKITQGLEAFLKDHAIAQGFQKELKGKNTLTITKATDNFIAILLNSDNCCEAVIRVDTTFRCAEALIFRTNNEQGSQIAYVQEKGKTKEYARLKKKISNDVVAWLESLLDA
ncbi:MAG: hypothetical protein GY830_07790 [Bacteroidetes bacterium]|nr:hypothetical protein [Bacteroidota bacterium]